MIVIFLSCTSKFLVVGKDDVQSVKDAGYKVTKVKEINSKIVKVYYR
jgi:hypothetical protein